LPVLEAMQRGLPVACSNVSSLPEVAGDAGLYFDPRDTGEIRDSIERILNDARLAERLSSAGREQAARFSWDRAARETIDSYRRAIER
jgi:alpha-1,3-rhamnosyl/mannosyltransferase